MNGFHDFDDFRVSAWMSEGLMTKASNIVRSISTSIGSAGAVAVMAVALATTPMMSVAHTAVTPIAQSQSRTVDNEEVMLVERLGKKIDDRIANFAEHFNCDVDTDLLALAEQALASMGDMGPVSDPAWTTRLAIGA